MEKSDMLFLIIGTNPMPNLISAIARVKYGAKIICIYTQGTKEIYENFKDKVKKIYSENQKEEDINFSYDIEVDKSNSKEINEKLEEKFSAHIGQLLNNVSANDALVELNFTGGTKVMSSVAYKVFKNVCKEKNINGILSYIDGEKETIYYEKVYKEEVKSENLVDLKDNVRLSGLDIVELHNENNGQFFQFQYEKTGPYDEYLGEKIFSLFKDNDMVMREKGISLLEEIYNLGRKYVSKMKKGNFQCFAEKVNKVLSSSENPFEDIKVLEDFAIKHNKKLELDLIESLSGFWFEDYVFKLLLELKEEGVIEYAVNSLSREYEIDLIAYRRYKMFCISVTSIDTIKEAKSKLYEIKLRANQLGGEETGICYINLCKDSKEFESIYRDIWDNEEPKNTLIICQDRFKDMKDRLRAWIKGEKYND
ncbi:hypothetical protein ACOAKC_04940 [Hathewaya histolytica]|uniref:hypothetical protein n=1 Tax=Hathewaya histolytica TaxID=1498 RepID=UPI003B67DB88